MSDSSANICPNCNTKNESSSKFCSNCGQKTSDSRITFSNLWSEFQDAVFNIESRTWKTLKYLFIPGRLTLEYFSGKRRRYVHPLRLLIVTSALVIIAMSFQGFNSSKNYQYNVNEWILKNYERQSLLGVVKNITEATNSIFPEQQTKIITDTIVSALQDSLLLMIAEYPRRDGYGSYVDINDYAGYLSEKTEFVSKHDFLYLDADALTEKYKKDESSLERLIFRQKLKLIKDESAMFADVIGHFSWATLLMMPCLALVLYFLYYRRGYYYIEHLIFTFHVHAFVFIIFALLILGMNLLPAWIFFLSMAILWVYVFFSLLRVYQQRIAKTLLKFLILNVTYLGLFVAFLFGTIITSFLLL